jgi:ribosome maturation factor RimP
MDTKALLERVWKVVPQVIMPHGYELIEVEYLNEHGRWILRLYIDRAGETSAGGINIDDCEAVSNLVSPLLDAEDLIPHSYNLEVSSPGIPRPIRRAADFERFKGRKVVIKTESNVEGRRNFSGTLRGVMGTMVLLEENSHTFEIPIESILKARLKEM